MRSASCMVCRQLICFLVCHRANANCFIRPNVARPGTHRSEERVVDWSFHHPHSLEVSDENAWQPLLLKYGPKLSDLSYLLPYFLRVGLSGNTVHVSDGGTPGSTLPCGLTGDYVSWVYIPYLSVAFVETSQSYTKCFPEDWIWTPASFLFRQCGLA